MEPERIILTSERLKFRSHIPADRDAFCAMEMDTEVRRFVGGKPRLREDAESRFNGVLKPTDDFLHMWATVITATGEYIGRCGIIPHFDVDGKPINGEASLGYYIAHAYWGNGYATEAGRAFIDFGFNNMHLNHIFALVEVGNNASIQVLEKLGFENIATEHNGARSFYKFALQNPRYFNQ